MSRSGACARGHSAAMALLPIGLKTLQECHCIGLKTADKCKRLLIKRSVPKLALIYHDFNNGGRPIVKFRVTLKVSCNC